MLFTALIACEKSDLSPSEKLRGTWTLTSFVATSSSSPEAVDIIAELKKIYPCITDNRITFSDGAYENSIPESCQNESGEPLRILPSAATGTYTFTPEDNGFSLNDDGFVYEGNYRFEGKKEFIFTIEDGDNKLVLTYDKK